MKIRNPWTYVHDSKDNETFSLPSMVEPEQSMSIREMVDRVQRGLSIKGNVHDAYYELDENEERFDVSPVEDGNFDLADYTEQTEILKFKQYESRKNAQRNADTSPSGKEGTGENNQDFSSDSTGDENS